MFPSGFAPVFGVRLAGQPGYGLVMSRLRTAALLLIFGVVSQPLAASTVIFRTDAELIALSERVVHARVVGQRTAWGGPQGRTIYTVTTLTVIEDFTGQPTNTLEVWELGGAIGREFLYVGGGVEYRVGEEVLVCLERGPQGLRSVAMNFSKFDLLPAAGGDRQLARRLTDTIVYGGIASVRERTLTEFRELAAQVTGRRSQQRAVPREGDPLESVQQPFTRLGGDPGWRWIQADSGTPVTFYKNSTAPPPLVSGDATSEIQTALAAWTNPTTASIILQYGGVATESNAKGPWTGISGAAGLITFEDPNNEISGSVLAIGGGSGFAGAGGTVNGITFNGFTRGYVIFQNAGDLSDSFRQSLNFSRVLTHEIGHTIGFGHTQTDGTVPNPTSNLMHFSCCFSATPIPPAIGPDDLAGLNFIYPAGSSSCSFSLTPTSASASGSGGSGSVSVATQAGCGWAASSNAAFLGISSGTSGSGPGTVTYTVVANGVSPRSGTLTIAGQTFTVNQSGAPCTFTLNPASATVTAAPGSGSVGVSGPTSCTWTASSDAAFLSITSGDTGSGNGTVNYSVTANGVSPRSGTLTIAGQTFTVNQNGTGPTVTLDKSSLRFGATNMGTVAVTRTSAQVVRLTQSGGATVSWTATSNQSWLVVSPSTGSGAGELSISVAPSGLATPATVTGAITLSLNGAGNFVAPIDVTLAVMPHGTSANPLGVVDTPADNVTGVTGAVPFTGWALDDVEVADVFICRAVVAGEQAPFDPNCGGAAQIFVGSGLFIDGTRPDVQAAFSTYPRNSRGGWGFMVLTNMLPSQGNGVFVFYMYAVDREGHVLLLGTRTMTCANANATTPFGTIDTPGQGDTASGSSYVNFGWALTQQPKFIPQDGSTITVFVDGVPIGNPSYNHFRSDIATLFPGLANSNGAIGFRVIDTTALSNGLHTIVWTATDSAGMTGGLGSRFFRVSSSAGAVTAAAEGGLASASILTPERVAEVPVDRAAFVARRGWSPDAPWRVHNVGGSGRAVMRGEELDRFELSLGEHADDHYSGYLRVGPELAPLPIGSQLNPTTGSFTWSPGLGFVGSYDLVFLRWNGATPVARREVRIILHAKGSGLVGAQVMIDTPASQQDVGQPFVLAGWAADLNAAEGSGIDTLHVWAYPLTGGAPIFVGAAAPGGARPDVAAVHGEQFRDSGYGLIVQGLPHGNYDLAVFAWSNVSGGFVPAKVVRITVR